MYLSGVITFLIILTRLEILTKCTESIIRFHAIFYFFVIYDMVISTVEYVYYANHVFCFVYKLFATTLCFHFRVNVSAEKLFDILQRDWLTIFCFYY